MCRRSCLAIVAVGLVLAAGPAWAHWSPGDPHKMHFPQRPDPWGWDVAADVPRIVADDFLCTGGGPITDVHLWGSWLDDRIGQINMIRLGLHADIPDPDGSGPAYSMPGPELWFWEATMFGIVPIDPPGVQGWYDPGAQIVLPNNHVHYFQYNIYIPEPLAFRQVVGTIYWLSVQVWTTGGQWGWKTSINHWNDDAVWSGPGAPTLWNELIDPLTGISLDMAFVITPEPAVISLVLMGGAALLRSRRR